MADGGATGVGVGVGRRVNLWAAAASNMRHESRSDLSMAFGLVSKVSGPEGKRGTPVDTVL